MQVIASYQVSAFTVPANATPNDADQVRGNDNTLRAALNSHDGDSGIHFQSSTLAARPAAGILGQKWLTTDTGRVYYDDGSNWQEIAYLPINGGVNLTLSGVLAAGGFTFTGGVTNTMSSVLGVLITSTAGTMQIQSASAVQFRTGGDPAPKWSIQATGEIIPLTDNVYDLGSTGNRLRVVYTLKVASAAANSLTFSAGGVDRWKIGGVSGELFPVTDNNLSIGGAALRVADITCTSYKAVGGSGARQVLGVYRTGWASDPTGTLDRTTFISDSVTLVELAKRVAALIVDLRVHGMIGP